jgi:hypothetical protein
LVFWVGHLFPTQKLEQFNPGTIMLVIDIGSAMVIISITELTLTPIIGIAPFVQEPDQIFLKSIRQILGNGNGLGRGNVFGFVGHD